MALQKQEIRVPFGGGIDTKTDKKNVIVGKLLALKNGVFSILKQITKRMGFLTPYSDQTVDGNTIGAGSAIYKRGKELITTTRQTNSDTSRTSWDDGWLMHSHGPDEDEWKTIGYREPLSLGVETIQRPVAENVIPDVALADSEKYACYAWLQLGDSADATVKHHARATVVELANDNVIIDNWSFGVAPIAAVDVEGVHVVGIGNIFYVWIAVPTENDIYLAQINTTTLSAAGVPVVKITDLHEDMVWDVCTAHHSIHGICSVVAYKEAVNGYMFVKWFNQAGVLVGTYTGVTAIKNALTVFEEYDARITLSYKVLTAYQVVSNGMIHGTSFSASNAVYGAPNYCIIAADYGKTLNMTGCKDEAADHYNWPLRSYVRLYVEYRSLQGVVPNPTFSRVTQAQYQFIGSNNTVLYNHDRASLASKAWNHDGKPRVWFVHDSWGVMDISIPQPYDWTLPDQNTYFLMSPAGIDADDRVDARLLAGRAGGESHNQSISQVVSPETDKYLFAALRQDVIIAMSTNATFKSVIGATTKFNEVAQLSTELGPTLQTSGGFIGEADGRFQENNFHLYPKWLKGVITMNGSSGAPAHWWYCVVYEWTDREGQRHQSQPSQALRVPLTGNATNDDDHVTIRVGCLTFGDMTRLRNVRCVLYRTTNQVPGADLLFYRLPETVHKFNDPELPYISLWDGPDGGGIGPATDDDIIKEKETLYTTGGVIGNICPPASSIMNIFNDRIMLVPDEDKTNIFFSKLKKHGIAVSFSDYFTKRITDGGDATAMIAMDSRQIVFKASEIRAFAGAGPNDLGQGSFSEDHLITSDVGCVDRASVVGTDKGVLFKSAKGIYLLGRNLQVNYIGAPVESFNGYRVVKAGLVENKNQVRFLLESSDMLVYDYLVNQWSIFEHPQSGESHVPWDAVDSAIWQDKYVMIKDDGTVFLEQTGYEDVVDSFIPLDLTTAWIKLNGLQGYQRVWWISMLGEVYGTCVINYEIFYNYLETNPQTGSITVDADFATNPPAQFRIKPRLGNGKCQAFKIRLYDAALAVPAGTQKGFAVSDIMIQIGKKSGVMRQGGLKTR